MFLSVCLRSVPVTLLSFLSLAATYREIQVLMATAAFVLGVGGIFFVCMYHHVVFHRYVLDFYWFLHGA